MSRKNEFNPKHFKNPPKKCNMPVSSAKIVDWITVITLADTDHRSSDKQRNSYSRFVSLILHILLIISTGCLGIIFYIIILAEDLSTHHNREIDCGAL